MSNALRFRTEPTADDSLQQWRVPANHPPLEGDRVHLWRASLDCDTAQLDTYAHTLSPDEQERAARFKFEHLRRRFIAGRGILRELLGRYLAIAPTDIQFTYGTHGKPFLDPAVHPIPLSFNLAHSQDRALFAFSRTGQLGVDIEHIRPDVEALALSQRFFTQQEHQAIAQLPRHQQSAAFFCLWTCKEAHLKATGEGLAGLQSADIAIQPDGSVQLAHPPPCLSETPPPAWSLHRCWPGTGYVGAIALSHPTQTSHQVSAFGF